MTESRTFTSPAQTTISEPTATSPQRPSSVDSEPDTPSAYDPRSTTTDAMQQQVYELVRARVLESIGAGGNWTVTFRSSRDTDTFFSDTMADMIAWDVATKLLPPVVPNRARLVA